MVSSLFPQTFFYLSVLRDLSAAARVHKSDWLLGHAVPRSQKLISLIEAIGGRVEYEGFEHLKQKGPVVFVANHMSTLETFMLPGLIVPFKELTFILKQSLLSYPILGKILRAFDVIAVTRQNAREDLRTIFESGVDRLEKGISVIIFPQSTRKPELDRKAFNSMGAKLAARANVPMVPIALDTRFWGAGKLVKDIGHIDPGIPVRISVGEGLEVKGNGKSEHEAVLNFIAEKLKAWQVPVV